jgi:hypothetical protein
VHCSCPMTTWPGDFPAILCAYLKSAGIPRSNDKNVFQFDIGHLKETSSICEAKPRDILRFWVKIRYRTKWIPWRHFWIIQQWLLQKDPCTTIRYPQGVTSLRFKIYIILICSEGKWSTRGTRLPLGNWRLKTGKNNPLWKGSWYI